MRRDGPRCRQLAGQHAVEIGPAVEVPARPAGCAEARVVVGADFDPGRGHPAADVVVAARMLADAVDEEQRRPGRAGGRPGQHANRRGVGERLHRGTLAPEPGCRHHPPTPCRGPRGHAKRRLLSWEPSVPRPRTRTPRPAGPAARGASRRRGGPARRAQLRAALDRPPARRRRGADRGPRLQRVARAAGAAAGRHRAGGDRRGTCRGAACRQAARVAGCDLRRRAARGGGPRGVRVADRGARATRST